jgi:hypothetical protein
MGPFFEIAAYAPCETNSVTKKHIDNYLKILSQIGIKDTELSDLLQTNAELLSKHEFVQVPYWYDIQVLDIAVSIRPLMMSWSAREFALLDRMWVQVGLLFDSLELMNKSGHPFGQGGDSFPRGMSRMLWKLIRSFAADFGSEGVFFQFEDAVNPWEVRYRVLNPWDKGYGEKSNHWDFHMAFIPYYLQGMFEKPPDHITMKRFEDGIGFVSSGTEQWPIVWQEFPWNDQMELDNRSQIHS